MFLFSKLSRPVLGPTQPPNQWVQWLLSGEKRPMRDGNSSPLPKAHVKNDYR